MDMSLIGGADGPTTIFISSSFDWIFFVAAVVIAIGITLLIIFRKQRRD